MIIQNSLSPAFIMIKCDTNIVKNILYKNLYIHIYIYIYIYIYFIYIYRYIYIYIYIYNNNNKIRFGNCLGEGRSRAYQVFHPFMITRRKNYIGI